MRDSKMTVSTTNILKSAAAAAQMPGKSRDRNMHIGSTLRDLYFTNDLPETKGGMSDLLQNLEDAEKRAEKKRRN